MERFQKIKAGRRKLDVTLICRFCGLENDEKYNILELNEDGVAFATKISSMMNIHVHSKDKMPPNVCFICMDKINDFYEFRLMALNTDKQTREALGLPLIENEEKSQSFSQSQPRPKFEQLEGLRPVVQLVDLKYSVQDQLLIKKALSRLAQTQVNKEPNIPFKRNATITSQQYQQQPPMKKTRKDISCNICVDVNFSYLNDLHDHQLKEHLPLVSKYACGSCRETFEQLSDFKDHENMHSRQKLPYTCYICYSPYAKLKDFQKHMTNYNCKGKEKLTVTVEDIRCFQCKKKFLTQNLFEWHGCFVKTRGSCLKCGQFFPKKKTFFKHYIQCDGTFVTPEAARDPHRIKSELLSPSSRKSVVKVTGVRKKTVPQRRMTTIKSEKEVNLANVTQQQLNEDENDEDEYANYEEDITYDNFGSDEDNEDASNFTNLEPVVHLQEQSQASESSSVPRIIDIKVEVTSDRLAVKEHTLNNNSGTSVDAQIIKSIKREQGSNQPVVSTLTNNKAQQQQLALRIKTERGVNEQPVVQVLNPLAIDNSAKTALTVTARKKVFKLPHELAMKIKQEKMSTECDSVRDEAEPDSEEEAQMTAALDSPSTVIKEEKLDSAYGDDVEMKQKVPQSSVKQVINPMALAMMREKSSSSAATLNGSEGNSLVIAAVTSMSENLSTNGQIADQNEIEPQNAHENCSSTDITGTTDEEERSNSDSVKESPSSSTSLQAQVLNSVMVEIPAEFSKTSEQHISPASTEMSTNVSTENNEVATASVTTITALNTNDDDELNQLLENLEKYGGDGDIVGGDISVANNLQDSDLQDLLKFD